MTIDFYDDSSREKGLGEIEGIVWQKSYSHDSAELTLQGVGEAGIWVW